MFILAQFLKLRSGCLALVLGTCGEAEPQEENARWSKAARLTAARKKMVEGRKQGRGEERGREGRVWGPDTPLKGTSSVTYPLHPSPTS